MALEDVWPLFALEVRSPNLRVRVVSDEDLTGLLDAVHAGIHDPGVMPFGVPWTDAARRATSAGRSSSTSGASGRACDRERGT